MNVLPIPCAFVFMLSILLWAVFGCRGRWKLKLLAIVVTFAFGVATWMSLSSFFGYPRETTMTLLNGKTALVYWLRVSRPDEMINPEGKIYFWMKVKDEDPRFIDFQYGQPSPVLYRLPYDKELGETSAEITKQIIEKEGRPVEVQFTKQNKGKSKQNNDEEEGSGQARQIYILPPHSTPKNS